MAVSKLIQITDLHLGEGPQSVLAGIRPLDSFKAVLHAINDYGRGDDLLLLSGDLSGTSCCVIGAPVPSHWRIARFWVRVFANTFG